MEAAAHVVDRLDRRVGAEIDDAPAARAQREPERDEAEVVVLARQAGEHGRGADPHAPAAGDAEQPATQDGGGEVLLGDRCVAACPALSELAQVGQHDFAQQRLQGGHGQEPVEDRLCPRLVEAVQRVGELFAQRRPGERRRRRFLADHGARRGGGRLGGGQPVRRGAVA